MKQTFFLVFLTYLYTIFGQPYLFTWLHLGGKQYSLKIVVLLIMTILISAKKYSYPKTVTSIFSIFTGLYIISGVYNSQLIVQTLFLYLDILFFYLVFICFLNNDRYRSLLYKFDFYLVHIVALSCVLAFLGYLYMPNSFLALDVADYPVFYNRFVGMISAWGIRTCWYFAEPSYCGFYLGMHFILYLGRQFDSRIKKILSLFLVAGGLITTASLGSAFYIALSLIVFVAIKLRINKNLIIRTLYLSIFTVLIVLPNFDIYSINQEVVDFEQSSFDDRQERLLLSKKIFNEMGLLDYVFGCGVEYSAAKYKYGLSDVYNKLLCEHGFIYLVLFLFVLRKFLKDDLPTYTYVLLSYLSVIIHATPVMMLAYLATLYQSKLKNNTKSFVWFQIK